MTQQDQDNAKQQAEAQLASIRQMIAAASLDWDRLEELRDLRADHEADMAEEADPKPWPVAYPDEAEELAELEEAAGEYRDREDAEEAIYNDPLCIQYRSGWVNNADEMTPEEFYILLCTGGPAVRIIGDLDEHGEPCRAWLEYQDWGTPWTMLFEGQEDALEYARRLIVL
jgi:hypothetical protein